VEPGTMPTILNAALEYAGRGWLVVPLHARQKRPHPTAWQKAATDDIDVIQGWWEQWPDANVGVKLGKDSNLIDIECDNEEAEKVLLGLFGGEFPFTPTYSGKRGKHRLFKWRDDLPHADKAVWKIGALEFRTGSGDKGAQSVFPPSVHPDGGKYEWVIHPSEADVAELSDRIVAALWNSSGEDLFSKPIAEKREPSVREKLYTQDEILETIDGRDNVLFAEACNIWREKRIVYGPGAFDSPDVYSRVYQMIWAWNRAKCRPPLDDAVIRAKVESAKSFIKKQTFDERSKSGLDLTTHGLEWRDGEWWPGEWSLTVILSDPPTYRLSVPAWKDLIGGNGDIELSAEAYREPGSVAHAIFAATKTVVVDDHPGLWPAIWNGTKGNKKEQTPATRGLKAKLMDHARQEEAPAEWKRGAMLADMLAEKIAKAKSAEEPDQRGNAVRMPDGTVWIRWSKAWELDLAMRKLTPQELQRLAKEIGLGPRDSRRYPSHGTERFRYFILKSEHLKNLEERRGGDTEQ
jgi:hypothetical protein